MIAAVVRRKLGSEGSRARERSEDLLTSTAFGLLRYFPVDRGIVSLLRRLRPVCLADGKYGVAPEGALHDNWLCLNRITKCEFEFWPRVKKTTEPDLLLRLMDEQNQLAALVVVEIKLDSIKSGSGKTDHTAADEKDHDQLAKYWRAILSCNSLISADKIAIAYFTSDVLPPLDELTESMRREPGMRLAWLSWRKLYTVAEELQQSHPEFLPAEDLVRLLEFYQFQDFKGFDNAGTVCVPCVKHFWRDTWFRNELDFATLAIDRFWSEK